MVSKTEQGADPDIVVAKKRTVLRQPIRAGFWLEAFLLLGLATIFVWRAFLPAWRSLNTDFPNYYLAAKLYREGFPLAHVYDWTWFQRQKDHAGIEHRIVTFIPLTLYSAMPVLPLAKLPPLEAKRWWLGVSLLLLVFTGFLLYRMTPLGGLRVAILMFFAIQPLRSHFLSGQLHIVILFLLAFALWLHARGHPVTSGVVLALASAIKIYPIFFIFYFIRKRQWRAAAGLAAGALLLSGLAVWLFGIEANRVFIFQILPRALQGDNIDPYNVNWISFAALFHRLFVFEPTLNPHPLMNFPPADAVLQPLLQALLFVPLLWLISPGRTSVEREKLEYAAYVVMLLLLSTSASSYHYVILILPVTLAAGLLLQEQSHSPAALLVVFYVLACLPDRVLPHREGWPEAAFAFSRLYFTLALFLVLFLVLSSLASETWSQRVQSRSAVVFISAFAVLFIIGWAGAIRRSRNEFGGYRSRVATQAGSLMLTQPAAAGNQIVFSTLNPRTYVLQKLEENRRETCVLPGDAFHPAVDPNSLRIWVELAGRTSNIVSFAPDECQAASSRFRVEVYNAEQPAISPDGKWLAFIREIEGRGSLWIKSLHPGPVAFAGAGGDRELAGSEFDVVDVGFEGKTSGLVFAAAPDGKPKLFGVTPFSTPTAQSTSGNPTRYPAGSPDGLWLAYSKLEEGNWHLWIRPAGSGPERPLVTRACNSLYPAWMPDSKTVLYATDCGRGLGLTALEQIRAVP